MSSRLRTVAVLILVAHLAAPLQSAARSHHHGPHQPAPPKPGRFDYYVLSLSWSPEHCAEVQTPPGDSQCGKGHHYAFVVHGLWPQYDKGGYPQTCRTGETLPAAVVEKTMDVMPSETLIRHEWQKHGSCSGLSPETYFDDARRAFRAVAIPQDFDHPAADLKVTAASVRGAFKTANPSIPDGGIAIVCNRAYLTEVRLCLAKDDFAPRSCGSAVRDSCGGQVTVRHIR